MHRLSLKTRVLLASAGLLALLAILAARMATPEPPPVTPPRPLLPIPTARQLAWQQAEMAMFVHFGVNTFTDREWGDGTEDPGIFNPTDLDARQWARVARETGFKTVILTAKHHDGFCLWPSAYTSHTVKSSPWRGGQGNVVRELAEACRAENVRLGLYLSPWDRHEPVYGDNEAYNAYYMAQLRELLTGYGPLADVWFDGAKGENAKDMAYDFAAYRALVRQIQPQAVMFSDEGPDVRWIGNENGFAGATNWSTMDRSKVSIGQHGIGGYLNTGEAGGPDWVPGECDVSIRKGWFWHPDQQPKTIDELIEIYFKSVGHNCVLLLNVPPDNRGRLSDADVERLQAFKAARDAIFDVNLAAGKTATANHVRGGAADYDAPRTLDGDLATYWATDDTVTTATMEVDLGAPVRFNVARIQEPVALGQRVQAYRLEAWNDGAWTLLSRGTTIGHKKLDRFEPVTAQRVRLVIESARACPLIAEFGVHLDPRRDVE